MTSAFEAEKNRTTAQPTLGAGNATDKSLSYYLNGTSGWTASKATISPIQYPPEESFYWRSFPRAIVVYMILAAMQYWWYIALEKILPARPRYKDAVPGARFEESEDREEEVVKKWIAQGRVNRASLNWCNTFLKWTLDMTVGRVWHRTAYHVFTWLLKWQHPRKLMGNLTGVSHSSVPYSTLELTLESACHHERDRRLHVATALGRPHCIHYYSRASENRVHSWGGVGCKHFLHHCCSCLCALGGEDGLRPGGHAQCHRECTEDSSQGGKAAKTRR